MSETRNCPECAEEIGAGDAKCRHCGATLFERVVRRPEESASCVASLLRITCAVIVITAVITAIAFPGLLEPRPSGNETGAIGALKTIGTAQSLFREADKEEDGNLDYGTLSELASAGATGLIDSTLGSGTKIGYLFEATYGSSTSEFIWFATARPALPTTTGDRYFCTNHEGVTFYSYDAPFKLNSLNCTIPAGAVPVGR